MPGAPRRRPAARRGSWWGTWSAWQVLRPERTGPDQHVERRAQPGQRGPDVPRTGDRPGPRVDVAAQRGVEGGRAGRLPGGEEGGAALAVDHPRVVLETAEAADRCAHVPRQVQRLPDARGRLGVVDQRLGIGGEGLVEPGVAVL